MSNKHLNRSSDILCSNSKCAHVNGREGIARQPIKDSVIARAPKEQGQFLCYYCQIHKATGMTKKEVKAARDRRKKRRAENGPNVMTAETT